jgi:glycerate-2-kinase
MSDLQKAARAIFFETLRSVDLPTLIHRRIRRDGPLLWVDDRRYDFGRFTEVVLIGIGKASLPMGYAMETLLGAELTQGLLVSNRRDSLPLKSEVIIAGHPLPNANSLRAGKRAIEILSNCHRDSLVIFLISGGGSALFESLISDEITLEDLRQLNRVLVECGATIEEINTVRKQFSAIKGGRLRQYMNVAEVLAILVSDVNAGDFKTLASNPLFPEENAANRFKEVVARYDLASKMPRLFERLSDYQSSAALPPLMHETAKIETCLLAENRDAVHAASEFARGFGYTVHSDWTDTEEYYRAAADRLISMVSELKQTNRGSKVCLISGGEVSCPVRGQGFGGRNQEFALYCAARLQEAGLPDSIVLSCGTDGIDGRSIAVGAIAHADQSAGSGAEHRRLHDYFQSSDTTSWFNEYGGLIVTGPTGNNLRDLRVILCH